MFLHTLNDRQLTAFLSLAKQFIAADDVLSGEEHNHLELMMAEAGWDFDQEVPDRPLDELVAELDSGPVRRAALLELVGVGHADSHFSPQENAFIQDLAERWGLRPLEIERIENWVTRQIELAQEAEEILSS
jgi:hypothetical protein